MDENSIKHLCSIQTPEFPPLGFLSRVWPQEPSQMNAMCVRIQATTHRWSKCQPPPFHRNSAVGRKGFSCWIPVKVNPLHFVDNRYGLSRSSVIVWSQRGIRARWRFLWALVGGGALLGPLFSSISGPSDGFYSIIVHYGERWRSASQQKLLVATAVTLLSHRHRDELPT